MQDVLEMMTGAGAFRPIVIPGPRFFSPSRTSVFRQKYQAGETKMESSVAPDITLISQTVEILLAPDQSSASPRVPQRKAWVPPVYDVEPEEEKRVLAMRTEQLVSKTVTGSYFTTGCNRTVRHWIRWNNKKCDNVYIHKHLVDKVLGPEPKLGTRLRTKITELGPDTATAWRMHPQCTTIELVPRTTFFSQRTSGNTNVSSGNESIRRPISLCSSRSRSPTDGSSPTRPRFINTRADMSTSWRTRSPSPRVSDTMEG